MESFASLGLSEAIVRAVNDKGYTDPTPVQSQSIPVILAGRDLMAGAQTGTGKTAGFCLPILQRLSTSPAKATETTIRALILTPTRELAAQVEESLRIYGAHLHLRSMTLYGGVSIHPQIERLKSGVEIVVGTPGRLLDHLGQGTIDLSGVEVLVLDEADRMLDMGFIRDIQKILGFLPESRQNLLFSATFSPEIRQLADSFLKNPESIQATPVNATAESVRQIAFSVDRERKRELLIHLIRTKDWQQILVFTRTKHGANRLAQQLSHQDIPTLAIHGNKSQSARTRALSEFKAGTLRVLVATDIAARGIDIKELPHVVNYDLPNVPEDYVHRIGRTGRAGAQGEAYSLVSVDDQSLLKDIERFTRLSIPLQIMEGFEPDPNAKPLTRRSQDEDEDGPGDERAPMGQMRQGRHRRKPRPQVAAGQGAAAEERRGHPAQNKTRRPRFEKSGQPQDNANRSPTALATGHDHRGGPKNKNGKGRHNGPARQAFDPNRPAAPSEIVAFLQGKRPAAIIDGIPEEDRIELGLAPRPQGERRDSAHGNGSSGGPSGHRHKRPPRKTGQRGPRAERPLHERFPGLPQDDEQG
jgi:ATP-dependent RNA helicase RhlE